MLTTLRKAEYFELLVLFFIQGAAMSMWFVPLGPVLDAHGLQIIKPFAFAASAAAAFVSPLIFGALADRHASPARVLRSLAFATAISMAIVSTGRGSCSHGKFQLKHQAGRFIPSKKTRRLAAARLTAVLIGNCRLFLFQLCFPVTGLGVAVPYEFHFALDGAVRQLAGILVGERVLVEGADHAE